MDVLDDDDLWRIDLFEVLGISQDATKAEIRNAYKNLAKQFHPDRFPAGSAEQAQAKERFSLINRAYEVLSHETKKAQYLDTRRLLAEHLMTATQAPAPQPATEAANTQPQVKDTAQTPKISADEYKRKQAEDSYKEGQRYFSRNQLDEAITAYQRAISLMPDIAKYHSALGQAYNNRGWKGMAQAEFKQALVLDPKDPVAKRLFEPEKPKKKSIFDGLKQLFKK